MKNIHSIEFCTGSKEELLPGFEKDFPYIASRAELDKYIGCYVPWHWHRTVELFYMESGSIEYDTPGGKNIVSGWKRRHDKSQCTPYDKSNIAERKEYAVTSYFRRILTCWRTGKQD